MGDPLLNDVYRPLDTNQIKKGWHILPQEYDYWVPEEDIEGTLPAKLNGTLFRNGPGLHEVYGKKLLHAIDGDGMIAALTFSQGRVHLRCKFVASKHRLEEQRERKFLYRGQMGTNPSSAVTDTIAFLASAITLQWPRLSYRNPSNTNVFYWGGKVISCYETGLPYCLDPHTLNTLGPDDLGGQLKLKTLAAHFRLDMEKDRLVCISVKPGSGGVEPSLGIYEFDRSWRLIQHQLHHIRGLNYAHDFLLLPDYYVFHMTPFVDTSLRRILAIYMGWSSPGQQMKYYSHLPSRFIVIPRHKQAKYQEILHLDTEPFHIFHFSASEQVDDTISFSAVCLGPKFNMTFESDMWLSNASVAPGQIWSFKLDLASKKCTTSGAADRASVEFPSAHPYRHGKKGSRYSYLMASDRNNCNLPYRDVVKFDSKKESRQVWYSNGCLGEPVFVPSHGLESRDKGDEDEGYLIVQLYIPEKHVTEFAILDAQHVDSGPIARIKLKHHIPFGFHGTFTPENFLLAAPKAKL